MSMTIRPMSALGQMQSFAPDQPNVCFAPKADIRVLVAVSPFIAAAVPGKIQFPYRAFYPPQEARLAALCPFFCRNKNTRRDRNLFHCASYNLKLPQSLSRRFLHIYT